MATITIRRLDNELETRLRVQAIEHERSMEDEARELLRDALAPKRESTGPGTAAHELFAGVGGIALETPPRLVGRALPPSDS